MQILIQIRALRVHINFTVIEFQAVWRLLIENDLKGNLITLWLGEEVMLLHGFPIRPVHWIELHRRCQELKALQTNFDV
jgi:hypothetical protein